MKPLIIVGAVGVLLLTGWAMWKTVGTALADRKRAAAEHRVRRTQHRLLLAAVAGLAGVLVLVVVVGSGGLNALTPSASSASAKGPCLARNTGTLTLRRTSATAVSWSYVHDGKVRATDSVLLTIRVDDGHTDSTSKLSGELTAPDRPVPVHIEGQIGWDRVYATCTI